MSWAPQGPGWWQANDGKWYPPEAQPGARPADYEEYRPSRRPALPSVQTPATASMFLGVSAGAMVLSLGFLLSILLALLGLPLGLYSMRRISTGRADDRARGSAVMGIVLNTVVLAFWGFWIAVFSQASSS